MKMGTKPKKEDSHMIVPGKVHPIIQLTIESTKICWNVSKGSTPNPINEIQNPLTEDTNVRNSLGLGLQETALAR